MVRCHDAIQTHTLEKNFLTTRMLNLTLSATLDVKQYITKLQQSKHLGTKKEHLEIREAWHHVCVQAGRVKSHVEQVPALLCPASQSAAFGAGLAQAGSQATLMARLLVPPFQHNPTSA